MNVNNPPMRRVQMVVYLVFTKGPSACPADMSTTAGRKVSTRLAYANFKVRDVLACHVVAAIDLLHEDTAPRTPPDPPALARHPLFRQPLLLNRVALVSALPA